MVAPSGECWQCRVHVVLTPIDAAAPALHNAIEPLHYSLQRHFAPGRGGTNVNSTADVARVLDIDNHLGESPLWSVEEQALYWVNCEQPPELHRWNYRTEVHDRWPMPSRVGGLVLRPGAQVALALADGIYDFNPANARLSLRARSPLPGHVKLHECQCDRQGRLWVGAYDHHFSPTTRDAKGGAYFRLDGTVLTAQIPGISVANALAFSPDGRTLYAADSPTRLIEAFDLNATTGQLSNRRPFIRLGDGEGFVDGATVDADGGYWLAAVGASALRRYRPDGSLDRVISLPFSNPTKPAFGGPDLDVLYVTSTKLPIPTPNAGVGNGGLFAVNAGVRGLPEPTLSLD
jgi:L-arabinonolactonase